ncbi:MAG: hypothetical protein DRP64_20060 [Verrucomicrobia bacterium]|nr:MAG: hypothetical protein DRP64_20060 [Verrucomicrobiota bacterium]
MNKTQILHALSRIVIPITFENFCRLHLKAQRAELQSNWDALLSTGYIGAIETQPRDLKQLTASGHQVIISGNDIDKLQEIPISISRHVDKVLFILANSRIPLSSKDTYKSAGIAKQAIHMHLDVLQKKGLIIKQGKIKVIRYSCTKLGIDKNNTNCQKTHPNRCSKPMIMSLIRKNGDMTLNKLSVALFSQDTRTRSRRSNLHGMCRALIADGKINYSKINDIVTYSFIQPEQRTYQIAIEKSPVKTVKKAANIAPASFMRQCLQDLAKITTNREVLFSLRN